MRPYGPVLARVSFFAFSRDFTFGNLGLEQLPSLLSVVPVRNDANFPQLTSLHRFLACKIGKEHGDASDFELRHLVTMSKLELQ
jgi:hypothetical protein